MKIRSSSRRTRLATLAAGIAALAVPAAANAAVTVQADATNLVLTSDVASDNITLGVNGGGIITHNLPGASGAFQDNADFDPGAGVLHLPSNNSVTLTINAGAGNDNVNVSAPGFAGNPVVNGQGGDDIILGSPQADQIDGGDGNDRITAFRGSEPAILGGNGNDVIIWANGDGNDVNVGGAGIDETLITAGIADDAMTVSQHGATTRFSRSNAPFSLDMSTVERLTVASAAGNDRLVTEAGVSLPMKIDAGPGADAVTSGGGSDEIAGGDGNDVLVGGRGEDHILGNGDDDTLSGGADDDRFGWNEGDGSDAVVGDAGADRIEVDLSDGDDRASITRESTRLGFERPGPDAFRLVISSSELLDLSMLGGDDTLSTAPGVGIGVVANGGAGNDTLAGTDAADTLLGGPGNDSLNGGAADDDLDGMGGNDQIAGGAGNDAVEGGDADDALLLRDGEADIGRGGAGADTATADAATLDTVVDVEAVDRPPLPQPPPEPPSPPAVPSQPSAAPSAPAPTRLGARVNISWRFARGKTYFSLVEFAGLRGGETATLTCNGRGCPFKTRTFDALRPGRRVLTKHFGRRRKLSRGATLEVRLTAPNTIGTYLKLAIRKAPKDPTVTSRCLRPGVPAPTRC